MTDTTLDLDYLIAEFTIPGRPISKFHGGLNEGSHRWDAKKRTASEARISEAFAHAGGRLTESPDAAFRVEAVFRQGTFQRRDVDNMVKHVLDGLNGIAWIDDAQVVEIRGRKEFVAPEDEATVVTVYLTGDMGRLKEQCQNCGKEFRTYPSWNNPGRRRIYCSRDCTYAAVRAANTRNCEQCGSSFQSKDKRARFCTTQCSNQAGKVVIPCQICGTEFEQYKSWAEMRPCCSPECSAERAVITRKRRASKHFPGTCRICGAGTTRKEYKRCNPCKLSGNKIPD